MICLGTEPLTAYLTLKQTYALIHPGCSEAHFSLSVVPSPDASHPTPLALSHQTVL